MNPRNAPAADSPDRLRLPGRDIWTAGHGVGGIRSINNVADIVGEVFFDADRLRMLAWRLDQTAARAALYSKSQS
jgi:hypothetical protein